MTKNPYDYDFTKMFGDFKMPAVNVEGFADIFKKNLDTIQKTNAVVLQAMQETTKFQADFVRQQVNALSAAFAEIAEAKTVEDRVAKQAAFAKENLQKAVDNLREVSGIVAKANAQSIDVVSTRMNENIDDLTGLVGKAA